MKAEELKKRLKTGYIVGDYGAYIGVGSSLCHDLLKLDKKSMKVSYALDTWHTGKDSVNNPEIRDIWDSLEEMTRTGEINHFLNGDDETGEECPVFYVEKGEVKKTFCRKYGWPNTTREGHVMYDNRYFKTEKEAAAHSLAECKARFSMIIDRIEGLEKDLKDFKGRKNEVSAWIDRLESYVKK